MVRNNNAISNNHFHKDWQSLTKVKFDQPLRKFKRRHQRKRKQIAALSKPVGKLRPIIQCPSTRYNTKIRTGRGYTLQELKSAGINSRYASTIGISVDYRRKNKSVESLSRNVLRLKEYKSKLILMPKKEDKYDLKPDQKLNVIKKVKPKLKARVPTVEEKKFKAFITLRRARSDAKFLGKRLKRKQIKTDTV